MDKIVNKENAFIRRGLTFWKCKVCGGWHEGQIYKCPINKVFDDIEKEYELGSVIGGIGLDVILKLNVEEIKKRHLSTFSKSKGT